MVTPGSRRSATTVDKTNRIPREIEEAYGRPKERRNQSYEALRGSCTRCGTG
jgi:hypothetical protein